MRISRCLLLLSLLLAGCQTSAGISGRGNVALPPTAVSTPAVSASPVLTPPLPRATPTPSPKPTAKTSLSLPVVNSARPDAVNLAVPFGSQAPYAVWDDLHNEACEEAAMLMVNAYQQREKLNPHLMEQGILNLVKWETEHGYSVDVTAREVVNILQEYFSLTARLLARPTGENIRTELAAGRVVIMPAAGRKLGNPNFRRPGPLYHMLVIRGYDPARDEFITNDPGTRKGEGYRYKTNVLMSAIHDWPKLGKTKDDVSEAEMNAGQKVVIIVGE